MFRVRASGRRGRFRFGASGLRFKGAELSTFRVQGLDFKGLGSGVYGQASTIQGFGGFRSMFLRAARMPWRSRQVNKDEAATSCACHLQEATSLESAIHVEGVGNVTCASQLSLNLRILAAVASRSAAERQLGRRGPLNSSKCCRQSKLTIPNPKLRQLRTITQSGVVQGLKG